MTVFKRYVQQQVQHTSLTGNLDLAFKRSIPGEASTLAASKR